VKYELIQSIEGIMPIVKNVKANRVREIGLLHFSNRYKLKTEKVFDRIYLPFFQSTSIIIGHTTCLRSCCE